MILLAYLALAWVAGFALTYVSRMPWHLEGRVAAGLPLGFAAAAMLTWLAAIPFGMSDAPVAVAAGALVLVALACLRWAPWQPTLAMEWRSARARWLSREALPLMILLALASLWFIPFYTHALPQLPDGLHGGYYTLWSDWPHHFAMSGYLSTTQSVLPPPNPDFAGAALPYPFLADFFSGILLHVGADANTALVIPSLLLSLALVVIFYSTALRLTGHRWAALVASLLIFAGGGLGFLRIIGDVQPTSDSATGWLAGLMNLIASPPHQYTMDLPLNYQWLNPILAYLVPQRTTLFGWTLGLLAISLIWHAWNQSARREMLIAGLLVGLMPFFQTNTYIDIMIIAGGVALLTFKRWRMWTWFFGPAVLLAAPQLAMLLPPPELRHPFGGIQLGWMAASGGHDDNWIWFWIVNTGLLIPLALATMFARRWGPPNLRRFLLPAWLLFIIPNIFVLQVWDWDNTKWFVWWAMPAAMLAALAIVRIGQRGRVWFGVAVLLVGVQVTAGAIDLERAWQVQLNVPQFLLLNNDEVALGEWARDNTPVDSVFLTGWQHNHPIRMLSGRPEVVGGLTSLWSTDIDYRTRMTDEYSMFAGSNDADVLLRHYNVGYVVIGPAELKDLHANVDYFKSRFPAVYRSPTGQYQVYRVG